MLTELQINQLQPLTNHPQYGELLKDAIETWKRDDVTPCYKGFGIVSNGENFDFATINRECCLLGAAIISRDTRELAAMFAKSTVIEHLYNITHDEFNLLWYGFDLRHFDEKGEKLNHSDVWKFGAQVRVIVKPCLYNTIS